MKCIDKYAAPGVPRLQSMIVMKNKGEGGKVKVTLVSGGGWGGGNFIVRTIAAIGVQNKY